MIVLLFSETVFAQSADDKWYFGLYRNNAGEEIVIVDRGVAFLNAEEWCKDYATFCSYVEKSATILAVYDELDMEHGIFVINKENNTASRTNDCIVDYNPADGSESYILDDDPVLDVYKKVEGLGPVATDKIRKAQEQRRADLDAKRERLIKLLNDNNWLLGVWTSSDGETAISVLNNGIVLFSRMGGDTIGEKDVIYPTMEVIDGEYRIYPPAPEENIIYINSQKKTLRTDFEGSFRKVAP